MSEASACSANASANASMRSRSIDRPAAARCPPNRSRCCEQAASPPCRSKRPMERPEPFHPSCVSAISTTGRLKRSTRRDATMPITPTCQSACARTYPRRRRSRGGKASTSLVASRRIRSSTPCRSRFSSSSSAASLRSLLCVLGQDQLERGVGTPEPARRVDPRSEPEADGAGVDGGRIDVRDPHELAQTGPARAGESPQARRGEAAVLVDERHDVRDRRERDEVEVLLERGVIRAEQCLRELVHDPGPAQLRERVRRGPRRHDRAVGKRVRRPVMVGHDHLEAERNGLRDLLHRGDPAVDGEQQPDSLAGHACERFAGDAVALLEAARKMPVDISAQLAQHEDCERGRADPVDVVVAVDADAGAGVDRRADALDGHGHVAEQERVVTWKLRVEEAARGSPGRRSPCGRARTP